MSKLLREYKICLFLLVCLAWHSSGILEWYWKILQTIVCSRGKLLALAPSISITIIYIPRLHYNIYMCNAITAISVQPPYFHCNYIWLRIYWKSENFLNQEGCNAIILDKHYLLGSRTESQTLDFFLLFDLIGVAPVPSIANPAFCSRSAILA